MVHTTDLRDGDDFSDLGRVIGRCSGQSLAERVAPYSVKAASKCMALAGARPKNISPGHDALFTVSLRTSTPRPTTTFHLCRRARRTDVSDPFAARSMGPWGCFATP